MFIDRFRHPLVALAFAALLTAPWVAVELLGGPKGLGLSDLATVAISGTAVLGASFMLAWGAETAEKDVPRAFAIAVLAVLAVAPEYAVDALLAWQAGDGGATVANCTKPILDTYKEGCNNANLAIANMTGANRILIGIGWSGIALFTIYRTGSNQDPNVETKENSFNSVVHLDRDIGLEIVFLLIATVFAFAVPFFGGIDLVDTLVLVALYIVYITIIVRGDVEEHEEQVGVPAYLQRRPFLVRSAASILLFAYSAVMIYTAVHPFAEGLKHIGLAYDLPPFFMIQWVAPLASESPELIVVAYLVNKARSTAGFNALISSKLNQWTLLIGTIAVVYSIAYGSLGTLPFDEKQMAEIWITAAQSLFAIAIITNFTISVREALVILVLFLTQVVAEYAVIQLSATDAQATELSMLILYAYTTLYVVLALGLFWYRRESLRGIVLQSMQTARHALRGTTPPAEAAD